MKNRIYILSLYVLLILSANTAFAQRDSVSKAILILQDQSLAADVRIKKAVATIDKAITNSQCVNDGYSWYIRGFIYKDWYKNLDAQNKKSKVRLDAVEFLKKALGLFKSDTSSAAREYSDAIRKTFKYLGSTFYNDAGTLLDPTNYATAIEDYDKFKECMLLAEPNYNLRVREIEFKNALATVYEKIFRNDIKINKQYFGMTEGLYKQVIALDTNNWAGNYNLAMLYYNYGVDLINNMSVTDDIVIIENIQEDSKALFKKALPYALKALELKPNRREVLVCLQGVYFSLYEFDKSDEYKSKIALLDKGK
jgi:tetratricopeptide (TPR) repeat protein